MNYLINLLVEYHGSGGKTIEKALSVLYSIELLITKLEVSITRKIFPGDTYL